MANNHHSDTWHNHNHSKNIHMCSEEYMPSNYSCHSISDNLILMIYIGIFLINFVVNSLVILVIALKRRQKSFTTYMILNLCSADLTTGIVCTIMEIPMETFPYKWIYGAFFCRLFYPIQTAMIYASVLTLVALSCSRYVAVVYPYKRPPSKGVAHFLIVAIWTFSFIVVIPYMAALEMNDESGRCEEVWGDKYRHLFSAFTFSLQYCIPITIITFTYSMIIYDLNFKPHPKTSLVTDRLKRSENMKMSRLVLVITVIFALCILPYHTVALWVEFGSGGDYKYIEDISIVAFFILYLNSGLNPILYAVLSSQFRVEVIQLWRTVKKKIDFCMNSGADVFLSSEKNKSTAYHMTSMN